MNAQKFDEIVEARANERVQAKIKKFKADCCKAFGELIGDGYTSHSYHNPFREEARVAFGVLASDNHAQGWPSSLWEKERQTVSEELLRIMDEMQKALLAASKSEDGENKPVEEKKS